MKGGEMKMNHEGIFTFPPSGEMISGKRYKGPTGAEFIVTIGGPGVITDGEIPFLQQSNQPMEFENSSNGVPTRELKLGKRFKAQDPATGTPMEKGIEILMLKNGKADLRCDGFVMELKTLNPIPSAD